MITPSITSPATSTPLTAGQVFRKAENGARAVTTVFDWVSVGEAAIGHGTASPWVQDLGGLHVALNAINSGRMATQKTDLAELNGRLKAKIGRDLAQGDLKALAAKIDHRAHVGGVIGLISSGLSGAAIATGHMGLGLLAIASKLAWGGYGSVAALQTMADTNAALTNQTAVPVTPTSPTITQDPGEVDMVHFYADWCGPCQRMKPEEEAFEKSYKGTVRYYSINVDDDKSANYQRFIAGRQSKYIPETIVVKAGHVQFSKVGFMSAADLTNVAKQYEVKAEECHDGVCPVPAKPTA